jgi:hypothetical protein
MQCLYCGGPFEWAGGGQHARCTRCLNIFTREQSGQLTPVVVDAPGGGFNPEFNAVFAQNLGFGPPPPGAVPRPPPSQQPQHHLGKGEFDMGGGMQLKLKVDGKTPENFLKDKASGMIWGWIIGAVIIGLVVLVFLGVGGYVFYAAKHTGDAPSAGSVGGGVGGWDGKSTFVCKGNDDVSLSGVTAKTSGTAIQASANCHLHLTGVNITAPVGIEASGSAKIDLVGGSINATTNAVVASNGASVDCVGTKITGKVNKSGGAKVSCGP